MLHVPGPHDPGEGTDQALVVLQPIEPRNREHIWSLDARRQRPAIVICTGRLGRPCGSSMVHGHDLVRVEVEKLDRVVALGVCDRDDYVRGREGAGYELSYVGP